jgi:type VI secretion system protein ImpJ
MLRGKLRSFRISEEIMGVGSKILWSEGMTLVPQHFQLQDIYHESRLRRLAAAFDPHFWGVQSVQWSFDGLAHDRLIPVAMSVVFPDGEVYDAPGTDLLPEPVDLSCLPADVQTFTFHLALPIIRPHGGNTEQSGRFARCDVAALDLFSEALEAEVPLLKKRTTLISHLVPRDSHTTIPVVQIHRLPNGGFEVDPSFIAPSIAIGASPALQLMLDGLISALIAKIESLQRMHRKTSTDVYEVSAADISSWWMLNIVNTAHALLRHSAQSPGHHPESLYEKLLYLAGGLMTFSDRYKATDVPAYRHDALSEVFAKMDKLLRDLVDTVIATKYFLIPLVADENRPAIHRAKLDPAKLTQETQLCLAINADMPALELVAVVPIRLKLGAPESPTRGHRGRWTRSPTTATCSSSAPASPASTSP